MKKIMKSFIDFLFVGKVMYLLAFLFRSFDLRIRKARGRVDLNRVANKGQGCLFHGDVTVIYPEKLILGNNVRIGYGAYFFAIGGIQIGNNTQVSRNVLIYSGNHHIGGDAIPYDDTYIVKPVVIGESVWVGTNVMITPGVNIGDGAIIGMGAVISKDVPKGAVVVGAEQRVVKYRDMEAFDKKNEEGKCFSVLWPEK